MVNINQKLNNETVLLS